MPVVFCPCGHRLEATDDPTLVRMLRDHNQQAHPHLALTDQDYQEVLSARARTSTWDGRRLPLDDVPDVYPLGPERLEDFLRFFDRDAFMDNPAWASCYCMFFHFAGSDHEWAARDGAQNREEMSGLIASGRAQGYLAYVRGLPVGWCHAAPRSTLPRLARHPDMQVEDPERVGSIVCFVVAAPYRRQGVAVRLLNAACEGFRRQGFAIAEGYPPRRATSDAHHFRGPLEMYLASGFRPYRAGDRLLIVRKSLGEP